MKIYGVKKAVSLNNPDAFVTAAVPDPIAEGHDLLIKVKAVSVNPVDKWQRRAVRKEVAVPKVLGYDGYGEVVAVGADVSLFEVGDKVFWAGDINRDGSNAEMQLVDERIVGHAPTKLTAGEIAAMPLTSITAYEVLFEQMHIVPEDRQTNAKKTILIINGAGGVGSVAIQLAKWAGLNVIATAGNSVAADWVRSNGADFVVDHHADLVKQVRKITKSVDYILNLADMIGHIEEIKKLIAVGGYIASITETKVPFELGSVAHKRVTFAWEWMFSKSFYQTDDLISQHEILDKIATLLDSGAIKSTQTKTFEHLSPASLIAAHQLVEQGHMVGKVTVVDN